jgi:hypothetical protein
MRTPKRQTTPASREALRARIVALETVDLLHEGVSLALCRRTLPGATA